jgi:nucleotide-binding universal stress UspA family protein
MGLFEKILVPLDGSGHSIYALERAIQIAKKFKGKITLIHAYTTHLASLPKEYALAENTAPMVEVSGDAGKNILADAKAKTETEGVQVETILVMGQAVETIVEASKNGKFDLIVIGARGLSPIKEILLGSVSHGVTTHAQCPVLVVK